MPFQQANTPTKVKWFQQALRNFVTPYGRAQPFPDASGTAKRLQPFTCCWLTEPSVAFSEMADSFCGNLPLIEENPQSIISASCIERVKDSIEPLLPELRRLNKKEPSETPCKADAKNVLKALAENDELDTLMESMFHMASAMMTLSGNYLIATSLIRHPQIFAPLVEGKENFAKKFKSTASAKEMKDYLLSPYAKKRSLMAEEQQSTFSRTAPASVKKVLFDSSENDSSDGEQMPKKAKSKKTKFQAPPPPVPSSSSSSSASSSSSDEAQTSSASLLKVPKGTSYAKSKKNEGQTLGTTKKPHSGKLQKRPASTTLQELAAEEQDIILQEKKIAEKHEKLKKGKKAKKN